MPAASNIIVQDIIYNDVVSISLLKNVVEIV